VEVEPISYDELRVLIKDSHMFLYEVLRRGGWVALQSPMAMMRAVAATNQAALV